MSGIVGNGGSLSGTVGKISAADNNYQIQWFCLAGGGGGGAGTGALGSGAG